MAHDVFISYSFSDQADADEVVRKLTTEYGIPCWICTRDIAKGAHYKRKITEAIEESQIVVLIQSKHAIESDQIPREISIALEDDKKVIPFRIDTTKLKNDLRYDLAGIEYIDATVPTKDQRIYELARSISDATGKPLLTDQSQSRKSSLLKSSRIACSEIFAGRDELMLQIHQEFDNRNVVFLHGMGGIGKSELARQYWKKHKDCYDTVVFAPYNKSLASLIAEDALFAIDGAARKMKDSSKEQTDEEYARDKLSLLKATADERTLIILDNFDIPVKEEPFFEELISDADYHVLVTTRCEPDIKKYPVIHVGEIEDSVLKSLFITYANPKKTIIEEDDPDFDELFRLSNRHTYTLELVAKYMEENDDIDYLSEMIQYLKENGFSAFHVDGYDNIYKLFRFTVLNETEKYFLRCLAMMPPAGIHQKQFKNWIGSSFSVRSRLVDLSLVKINGESRTLALHPVVREVILNELKPSYVNCREFMNRCAMVGEDAIPLMWSLPYQEKTVLMECYANFLQCIHEVTADTYPLFVNISYMYNYVGSCSEAIALQEDIYRFVCAQYGAESTEAMLIRNRIGWKYYNVQMYAQALPHFQAAADWFFENPYYSSRESLQALQNYASLLRILFHETKDSVYLENARTYMDKAFEYGQNMIQASANASENFQRHLKYQVDCMCRGYMLLCMDENNYELAEKYADKFKAVIRDFEKITGKSNADWATYYQQLGKLYYQTGAYQESKNAFEEAYRIQQQFFSLKNLRILNVLEDLGNCCIKLKDYPNAAHYFATALESAQTMLTNDHPTLARLQKSHQKASQGAF